MVATRYPLRATPSTIHPRLHLAHGFLDAGIERATDEAMPDVELVNMRERADFGDVHVIDAVAGVDGEAEIVSPDGAEAEPLKFRGPPGTVLGVGVGARVQFDPRRFDRGRSLDRRLVGVDEEACDDAGGGHRLHASPDALTLPDDIQAALGGDFLAALGD